MRKLRAGAPLVLSAVVLAAACRDPLAPNQVAVVNLATVRTIVVANRTSTPVFVMVIGRNQMTVIDYLMCADPDRCNPIAPGASRKYDYPGPFGGAAEKEAVVSWWHSTRGSDGNYRVVDVGGKVVPL